MRAEQPCKTFDLVAHLRRQAEFSERTFGPGARVAGVTDHIAKELVEVKESGGALAEWVDVIILGLDGAWRSGATPEQITAAIEAKQTRNEGRTWPDWRTAPPDRAIEHNRSSEDQAPPSNLRVYLCGPMTGFEAHNFPAFHAAAARLRALELDVVNPAELHPEPGERGWHECLRIDLAAMLTCQVVALLPGWQGSNGAHLEIHVAHRVGLTIMMAEDLVRAPA